MPTPIAFCRKGVRKPGITLDSVSVDHLHVDKYKTTKHLVYSWLKTAQNTALAHH